MPMWNSKIIDTIKKSIRLFLHKVRIIKRKICKNKNIKYRIRYLLFIIIILSFFSFGIFLTLKSFAKYESKVNLNFDVAPALYILEDGLYSFTLNMEGIVPRDEPYVYNFTISNFKENKESNVDLNYTLNLITTTNLPLNYKLYKNQNTNGVNILSANALKNDDNLAWYNYYNTTGENIFKHDTRTTDNYYLIVEFPKVNKQFVDYAGQIDSVEIIVDSKQILNEV